MKLILLKLQLSISNLHEVGSILHEITLKWFKNDSSFTEITQNYMQSMKS